MCICLSVSLHKSTTFAMSEKEFEREASQLLRGMGLQMDADVLNFFQPDNLTSGNEKWKEGLRKPSSPRRLRRARTTANATMPKDSMDGQAMRKHSTPAARTQSAAGGDVLDISRRSSLTTNGKHHTTEVENSSEHCHNSQHHHSYHHAHHHHRYHHSHHPQREHKLQPSPVDSQLQLHPDVASNARKNSTPSTIASYSTSTQTASQKTSDRKQRNGRQTPSPASLIPRPTSNARTAAQSNGTSSVTTKPPSSVTQVLYARKPSLKLLSVTTSSSSIVHSVADRKEQYVSESQVLQNDANQSASTTSPTSPPGNTTSRQSSPCPVANGVHSTYDRLELYHKMMSPEPVPSEKCELSSLARSGSINSNASQESAASVHSGNSRERGRGEERDRSSSQPPPSSRQRRWSTPTSVSNSSSMSRSPTPVPWDQPTKKTAPNSSGELFYTTDDSSQSTSPLGGLSLADHTLAASKDTTERKHALNHRTVSASPEPELRTMSALATTTVQALGTLMEVVTPATSMENLEEEDRHALPAGASSSTMKTPISNSSGRMQSAPPSITPTSTTNRPKTMNRSSYRTSLSAPPPSLPSSLPPSSQHTQPPTTTAIRSVTDTQPFVSVAETVNTQQRSESTKLRRQSLNEEEEEEFFGYCHKCGKTVVGIETGCLALGKVFHTNCFSCSICSKLLSGRTFYTIGSDILCEVDYLNKLNRCYFCNLRIKDRVLTAFGQSYHPSCFKCSVCGLCLDGVPYAGDAQDKIYCVQDYHKLFSPSCSSCSKPIIPQPGKAKNMRVIAQDQYYHVNCYKCEVCGKQLANKIPLSNNKEKCYPIDGHLFCNQCHLERLQGTVRTTIL